jgi:hypothetical protein
MELTDTNGYIIIIIIIVIIIIIIIIIIMELTGTTSEYNFELPEYRWCDYVRYCHV